MMIEQMLIILLALHCFIAMVVLVAEETDDWILKIMICFWLPCMIAGIMGAAYRSWKYGEGDD